jgi:hypothetical protein
MAQMRDHAGLPPGKERQDMRTSLPLAAVMALASAGCRRDVPADVPAASARPATR